MASILMMIGGALTNALAFTGSSFMFSKLSKNKIDDERTRHDKAIEKLQKAQVEWSQKRQQRIDFINKKLLAEKSSEQKFNELDDAMREYSIVFGRSLSNLSREPVLNDFYTPSDEQHERELMFITIGMVVIGGVLYYFERRR